MKLDCVEIDFFGMNARGRRIMKKFTVLMALAIVFYGSVAGAVPSDLTLDTYLHPNGPPYYVDKDIIGANPPFEIYGSRWTNSTTLEIWWDWNVGLNGAVSNSRLGDVFLRLDSGELIAVALRNHVASYDFGDTTVQGSVFYAETLWTSDDYYGSLGYTYGLNEVVTATGDLVDGASALINYHWAGIGNSYIQIQFSGLTNDDLQNYLSIAPTCANDIHKVPEPAALVLLGISLVGIAVYPRRKSVA